MNSQSIRATIGPTVEASSIGVRDMAKGDTIEGKARRESRAKGTKKTSLAIVQRRHDVARLYLEGNAQSKIAESLGVSIGTVNGDLQAMRQQWQERAILSVDDRKAEELARLDKLEQAAWEAFEKSKLPQTTVVERYEDVKAPVPKGSKKASTGGRPVYVPYKKVRDVKIKEGGAGDPRFLEEVHKCIQMRLRVLGLLKNDNTINNNIQINWAEMYEPVQETESPDPIKLELEKVAALPAPREGVPIDGVIDVEVEEKQTGTATIDQADNAIIDQG